jgi:putative ABC transport system permease protein
MRSADLLKLALSALGQQKVRTLLTTLGVVFGTYVLASSLSVGQGVQETITREARRHDRLRRIEVWPTWGVRDQDIPAEALRVEGEMSPLRRQQIREALRHQWENEHGGQTTVPLDSKRLRDLAAIDHVERVQPLVSLRGWVLFNGRSVKGGVTAVLPNNPRFRSRVIAGEFFDKPDEGAALVSEFLLYRCGIVNEADIGSAIGRTLRLEFRQERPVRGLTVSIINPDRPRLSREDEQALAKVVQQLPAKLDRFDLTPDELERLRNAAAAGADKEPPRQSTVAAEYVIKGVIRLPNVFDREARDNVGDPDADVILPQETGEQLYARDGRDADYTYGHATIVVDSEENVRDVAAQVFATGLRGHAFIEFIERERFQYLLIFYSMTVIAGVALLVAALGIANTMLMTVLERTREVGVMKAVGAADRHIRRIFLVEGGLIGLVGGTVGMVLAWAASFPVDSWIRAMVSRQMKFELQESLFVFPLWVTLGSVVFACVVTTVAAVYPAHRAARVNPIAALRHE